MDPYVSNTIVNRLCNEHNITIPKKGYWYAVLNGREGEINGLPHLRGRPLFTDDILAWFVRLDGTTFQAHIQHFIPDAQPAHIGGGSKTNSRATKSVSKYDEYE